MGCSSIPWADFGIWFAAGVSCCMYIHFWLKTRYLYTFLAIMHSHLYILNWYVYKHGHCDSFAINWETVPPRLCWDYASSRLDVLSSIWDCRAFYSPATQWNIRSRTPEKTTSVLDHIAGYFPNYRTLAKWTVRKTFSGPGPKSRTICVLQDIWHPLTYHSCFVASLDITWWTVILPPQEKRFGQSWRSP